MTTLPSLTSILTVICFIIILLMPISSVHPVFAATIFEDGFETGDLSKWTPTGGNPSVTSGDAHHGNYKAVLDATGEYAQKRFTGIDHCFMRAYVMFKSFPVVGTETTILGVYNWASSNYMAEARVGNFVSGTVKWRFRYYHNGVHYVVTSEQQKPVLDTWYCVEVEGKSNSATNSEAKLYINGNELTDISQTGINNTLPITCAYIWVNNAVTHWYDSVIVDTAYIGPEQCYLTVGSPYGTAGGQGWYDYGSTAHATLDTGEVNHDNGTRHVFTNWNGDATGTDYASSDPIAMTSNKTATAAWETQYNVTFTQTGLDSSASGTVVTVNDVPIDFTQLPYSIWIDNGDTVTYSYNNVSSTTGGQRFALVSVSGEKSPITITGPTLIQGNYETQYQIVFDQTGIGSDFTGTIITIEGADYDYTSLPIEFWWHDGSSHTFSFSSPLIVNVSRQYNWTSTSGLSTLQSETLTITGSGSVTGNYGTQSRYNITFSTTGVIDDFSDTVVTIDDINYTLSQLPISFWWEEGSSHTFSFQSPLTVTANSKQYVWTSTTGLSTLQNETIIVFASGDITADYKTQYLLTVLTHPEELSPQPTRDPLGEAESANSWWYDDSSSVFLTAEIVASYTFNYWTVDGVSHGDGVNPITVNIYSPHTAVAYYSLTDVTPPEISILSPENRTYYTANILLEFVINEVTSWIGYSLDDQANVTISGNTTITVGEGSHWIIVYANDSSGNMGSSNKVYFTARTGVSDIAIFSVQTSKTRVGQGYSLTINVTVENQGDYAESSNVTLYGNATVIGTLENVILPRGSNVIITFSWNTTDFAKGNYTITAYVEPVFGETDIEDNTFLDGSVYVGIPGDVAARYGQVDMKDVGTVIKAFGSVPGNPKWNPNMDINGDGKVDMKDIGIAIKHFGEIDK